MAAADRARRALRPAAPTLQAAAAAGGLLLMLSALAGLPYDGGPASPGTRLFFVGWCVAVPYWHWLEYSLLLERDEHGRVAARGLELQRLSRAVWLGGALALGAFVVG